MKQTVKNIYSKINESNNVNLCNCLVNISHLKALQSYCINLRKKNEY